MIALAPLRRLSLLLVLVGAIGAVMLASVSPARAASSSPAIESESVAHVTSTDATIEAQINPNGNQTTYEVFLESPSCLSYGIGYCESSGGELIAEGTIPASSADQSVSVDIASTGHQLSANTMYGYRVVATSSAGTKHGSEKTFTTPAQMTSPPGLAAETESPQLVTPLVAPSTVVGRTTTKPLTNAQKLTRALKLCAKKPKKQRASCRKQAHKRYGTTGKQASASKK
ncbi:MAG: hypothetical protein ACLP7W_12550 [Solirubrobacteraceae bacterium]